jgi:hypothetical protein
MISKFFCYRFSGRIRTFYRTKTNFFTSLYHDFKMKNSVHLLFLQKFQIRCFSFWITERIGLTGVSFHLWPQKNIPLGICHWNFWLFFHSIVKSWQILMFLGLIWCNILCWAQEIILLVQPKSIRTRKWNLLVMKF